MISTILKINTFLNSKTMRFLDVVGAIGILAYAGYVYKTDSGNYVFWGILGLVALILAGVKPYKYFSKKLENGSNK